MMPLAAGLAATLAFAGPAPAWAPPPTEPALGEAPASLGWTRLEIAARGQEAWPGAALPQELRLQRAWWEAGLSAEGASARVSVDAVRTGGADGYVGVAGQSLVPRFQVAEARVDLRRFGAAFAGGLVDDLWVVDAREAWALPQITGSLGEDEGWMTRSDVGAWAAWADRRGIGGVAVALTTGEGLQARERNAGQDLSGRLTLHPLALKSPHDRRAALVAYARDGSRGIDSARDHRAGFLATWDSPWVGAGLGGLKAWGVDGDGSQAPVGASAWVRTGPASPVAAYARVDGGEALPGRPDSRSLSAFVGAGPRLPVGGGASATHLLFGYEGRFYGPEASPLAGAAGGDHAHVVFIQLSSHLSLGAPLAAIPQGPPSPEPPR